MRRVHGAQEEVRDDGEGVPEEKYEENDDEEEVGG